MRNLRTLGCSIYETDYNRTCVTVTTERKDKILSFVGLDNSEITRENISKLPYIRDVSEEKVEILTNSFKRDIQIFTRQLVLPYDDFTEKMAELSEYDDFEKLDYLCEKYAYPREEIKKRMAEWKFIKEMEEKS